jgi:hypothetical protein
MKIQNEHMVYAAIIALTILYILLIEKVHTDQFDFTLGGRDLRFSAYDVALTFVGVVGVVLSAVSFAAYNRKGDKRLFVIALAFLFFTLKSVLNIIDNFFLGGYQFIGIAAQGFELLMILAFFLVLFKRQ